MIRNAGPEDAEAIAAVWNSVIRDSIATFNSVTKEPAEILRLLHDKERQGHPFLVIGQGQVTGFATYGQFRGGIGYSRTMEHTIHLASGARGQGHGRALMRALEAIARENSVHSMWAGISGENREAIRFHAAIGYREIVRLRQVGQKFDRWFDLVLMQKFLTGGS
ncbi:MAG: GNAT family N-acetyltransferase [Rhodobacteraceae bacterium]|nr:GNAT family N-acetyltransferase [Paracoccaceae bacterium]